ncbi:hypothetical protein KCU67_g2972, partial [Aureobasidium melanogenum]
MPAHPEVSNLLSCETCRARGLECSLSDKRTAVCTRCTEEKVDCKNSIEYELLQYFRDNSIASLVQQSLVDPFLLQFDRFFRRFPLLVHAALTFAALEKAPRPDNTGYHNLALKYRDRTISSFLAIQVDQHTWQPYYLSYLIFAPCSLQLCCSTARHDVTSEISQNLLGLRRLFARLEDFKADLDQDIVIRRFWCNPVTWGKKSDDMAFDKGEPVKLLYEAIDDQALSVEVKEELKVSVEQLYRIINCIITAQKGNVDNPSMPDQNNDKALFIWMSLASYSDDFFTSILAASDTGGQHLIWRTILCHFGFACCLRSSKVWYLKGVGELMLNEWLKIMREGKHLGKDGLVKVRNAMTVVAGKMGVENWEDENQLAKVV